MSAARRIHLRVTAPVDETDDLRLRPFYWTTRLAAAAGLLVLLVILSWRSWASRERRRLDAEVGRWRQAELTLDASAFETPAVPDDQNAVVALRAALAARQNDSKWWYGASGRDDETYLLFRDPLPPWDAEGWTVANFVLEKNRRALELFHEAAERRAVHWARGRLAAQRLQWGTPDSGGNFIQPVMNLLSIHLRAAMQRHDDVAFLRDVATGLGVCRTLLRNPTFAAMSVAANQSPGSANYAGEYGDRVNFADGSAEKRAAAADVIRRLLDWPEPADEILRATQNEASWLMDVAESPEPVSLTAKKGPWPNDLVGRSLWRATTPLRWRLVADELAMFRRDAAAVRLGSYAATAAAVRGSSYREITARADPAESIVRSVGDETPQTERYCRYVYRACVARRLAAVALASRMYAADHRGALPPRLEALVPVYLPAIPRDPYDPQRGPLRYRTTATTRPFVYSMGQAGQDYVVTGQYTPAFVDHMEWLVPNPTVILEPPHARQGTGEHRASGQAGWPW